MRRTELHSNSPKRLEPPNDDWPSEKRMTVSPDKMVQKLSAIQALPVSIAVLDSRGTIVGVNSRWEQFGQRNGLSLPQAGVGLNYLPDLHTEPLRPGSSVAKQENN